MKKIQNKLFILLFISLVIPGLGLAQDRSTNELRFEVNKVYPYISITKEDLKEAHTLVDLNNRYKPSWVREYISVEISTSHNGSIKKSLSKNDTLSQMQKDFMNKADLGKEIMVKVHYIPENTLKHNDPKWFDFTFIINPENEAKYSGGPEQMEKYLKEKAINKIPDGSFEGFSLTIVKFAINEEGEVVDTQVHEASKNESIDKLLIETISSMPCWKPAEYADGTKTKEEYILTVGNQENCSVYLFNTRQRQQLLDQ